MSQPFGDAMRELMAILERCYSAHTVALIPGSGTYAMEAAARAFGKGKKCMVIRNGYFSFRWTQIFEAGDIPAGEHKIEYAIPASSLNSTSPGFAPQPIEKVVSDILEMKPDVVFAPHVETSTGIILPDSYIKAVAEAVHKVGGLFVLDCIASGTMWINMKEMDVDVIISAPQKGWSGAAGVGVVLLNDKARAFLASDKAPKSSSFACDLKKWVEVSDKYKEGAFMYYCTLPTEAIMKFRDAAKETEQLGFDTAKSRIVELGSKVRAELEKRGFKSAAAEGFQAPGVVVVYDVRAKEAAGNIPAEMKKKGIQIAGPVAFMLGPSSEGLAPTFRIGLFGLDKWHHVDRTVSLLMNGFDQVL